MTSAASPSISEVLFDWARYAANDAGLPCIIAGGPKLAPSAPIYGEFWYRLGTPRDVDFDGLPWRQTPGLLQFTIYASDGLKAGTASLKAKCIQKIFSRQMWFVGRIHFIETEKMGVVSLPGVRYGKRITVVDGGFDFYEEAV